MLNSVPKLLSSRDRDESRAAMWHPGPEQVVQSMAAFVNRLPRGDQLRFGNSGRNTIIGPGIINIEFSVSNRASAWDRAIIA